FFNATAISYIYTLSLHDALPICDEPVQHIQGDVCFKLPIVQWNGNPDSETVRSFVQPFDLSSAPLFRAVLLESEEGNSLLIDTRSEEHTSELQSQSNLVCRLLLE